MGPPRSFRVTHTRGPGVRLHSRQLKGCSVPRWDRLVVTRPTVVLGSAQRTGVVDVARAESAGIDVVVRNSGGGAVWLDPVNSHWIDVTIGSEDPRWHTDIGAAFDWLGKMFVAALGDLGVAATAHQGRAIDSGWSRVVCFGGVGAGEVIVDGCKFVGMSQRRTRDRARFQVVFYDHFDPAPLVEVLDLEAADRVGVSDHLEASVIDCEALSIDPSALHTALAVLPLGPSPS